MPTPPCSALKLDGTQCGKSVGTVPTPDGPRCFSHVARDQRRADPGSRPPVRNPKTAEDVRKLVTWAMLRAAEEKLSAPSCNAVSSMARVWLRTHSEQTQKKVDAIADMASAVLDMTSMYTVAPENRAAFDAAHGRLQTALDEMHELQPRRESKDQATARTKRREGRENHAALASTYDAPLDDEVSDLLEDATPATETEDE